MALVLTVATISFLPVLSPRSSHTSAIAMAASHGVSVSTPRAAVHTTKRARPPLAFDNGSIDNLSDDQIRGLLEKLKNAGFDTLKKGEHDRVEVFERTSPSVANIKTSIVQPGQLLSSGRPSEYPAGAGSGFVWDTDGHIITNYHVVASALDAERMKAPRRAPFGKLSRKVTVKLSGRDDEVEAQIIGYEADKDLAVLKVDPANVQLTPLEIGSSSNLRVGQNVLAIGNPFGLDTTLTSGIVSALGRDIQGAGGRPIKDCIQTDAAINPGNSGGPLMDSNGRLIGINTMIYAPGGIGANVGIGFAIPVDTVSRIVKQIIAFGQDARPSLGVAVLPDSDRERYARSLGRPLQGAVIAEVVPGSPAALAKLEPLKSQRNSILLGDMITAVNGARITTNEELLCAVEEAEPEEALSLTVMRNCDPDRVERLMVTPVRRKSIMDLESK